MKSSKSGLDKRARTYARMIASIRHELNQALTEEYEKRGLTQAKIAEILGKDKGFISRKLNGAANMTLETLADLAFALDRPVRVSLPDRDAMGGGNRARMRVISNDETSGTVMDRNEPQVIWTEI